MDSSSLIQPISHFQQEQTTVERIAELKKRPVAMEVKGLGKTFGESKKSVRALDNVSFSVYRREFACIIGPSGCGKSTLIRILAGLETPTDGEVLVDGNPVKGPGRDRGMVFQSYTLFPWQTVRENIQFGPRMAGISGTTLTSDADQWMEMVGLEKFANHYPHQLSGGMKQRVAIARALANRPRILLMDEPFGALDAQTRAKMQRHLIDIWKHVNITICFIPHDLDEACYLSDRILVLDAHPGRINEFTEVPVERPRSPDQFLSPPFLSTKKHVSDLIHPPTVVDDETKLVLPKMTKVGDEVE